MNVGMIGLGKLGLPVALAIEAAGHNVFGYDALVVAAEKATLQRQIHR